MTSYSFDLLDKILRSGVRSMTLCRSIGICCRFLHHRLFDGSPARKPDAIRMVVERFRHLPGVKAAFISDCMDIADLLKRREAAGLTEITYSHYRETRSLCDAGAKRELLQISNRRGLSCRAIRKMSEELTLASDFGLSLTEANFAVILNRVIGGIESVHRLLANSWGILVSLEEPDSDYLTEKVQKWKATLTEVLGDVSVLAHEFMTKPASLPVTDQDAA